MENLITTNMHNSYYSNRQNQNQYKKHEQKHEQKCVQTNENYNHVLTTLQDYMLNGKLIAKQHFRPLDKAVSKHPAEKVITKQLAEKSAIDNFFYPKEKDTLFWCYYIIQNGFSKYEYPGATSFVNEKTEKFKCIELMRANKQQLKTKKIKNIREDVEDELANKQIIGMKTFIALCISSNINIMFIQNRKCFELIFDEQSPIYVVHCMKNSDASAFKYCYEMNTTNEQLEKYRNTLFKWESVDKPLKAISSYKLEELQELCKKLALDVCNDKDSFKNKTKKDLYETIIMNI